MARSHVTRSQGSVPKLTPRDDSLRGRVEAVGPTHFGIVAVDCAKNSARWRLADFYGHVHIPPRDLGNRAPDYALAVEAVRQACREHQLRDVVVVIERTGRYHLPVKRAFADADFEVRILDPLATHQYRKVKHAGNKTDDIDLGAIHAAAVHGFGLVPVALPPVFLELRDWARHRRDLVGKTSKLRCQIRDHLHSLMPGYAEIFNDIFTSESGLFVPLHFTVDALRAAEPGQLAEALRAAGVRSLQSTRETILAWARNAPQGEGDPQVRQVILTDLIDDLSAKRRQIARTEIALARLLPQTPYLVLLSIPGVNVVTAAEFAAEAGPITAYASGRAITGRAGLYPSRYQSGPVDRRDGPLVPKGNRRLKAAILRIADTLMRGNDHFRLQARAQELAGKSGVEIHVVVGNRFARIAYRMVAGGKTYRHPGDRQRDYIIQKMIRFYENHRIDIQETMSALQTAVDHLPSSARSEEARPLAENLAGIAGKRGTGAMRLGVILPSVLARFLPHELESAPSGELSQSM